MIQEAYVSFRVAELLEEKEFDIPIGSYYDNETKDFYDDNVIYDWNNSPMGFYSAPTHQMALAWLREKKIIINIISEYSKRYYPIYIFNIFDYNDCSRNEHIQQYLPAFRESQSGYSTYEEAVEAALKYSLKNLI